MIFVNSAPGAMHYVRMGYVNALKYLGYDVLYINVDNSYTNILEAFEPTHIIGSTWDFDYNHLDILKKIKPRLILRASEWSDYAFQIGQPLCLVTDKEKEIIQDLTNYGLIKYVNTYYTNTYLKKLIGGWESICGIKSSLLAADTTQFKPLKTQKIYDFSFIGGYWLYKSIYLNWIINLSTKINGVIYGGSQWPCYAYKGPISDNQVNLIFNQSVICPNVMEPVSIDYHFDVNERTYKTLASGTFSLIQWTQSAEEIFEDSVEYFKTEDELIDKSLFYTKNPKIPNLDIIKKHNYINRVNEFLNEY